MLAIFWHSENSNENLFVGDYLQMFLSVVNPTNFYSCHGS